ncbi:MAG: hypothetical protein ACPGXX_07500, partial [Planctomycetaceae bacterium]
KYKWENDVISGIVNEIKVADKENITPISAADLTALRTNASSASDNVDSNIASNDELTASIDITGFSEEDMAGKARCSTHGQVPSLRSPIRLVKVKQRFQTRESCGIFPPFPPPGEVGAMRSSAVSDFHRSRCFANLQTESVIRTLCESPYFQYRSTDARYHV